MRRDAPCSGSGTWRRRPEEASRLTQEELRSTHTRLGIVTEAWSPLAKAQVLDDPEVTRIASAHDRTPGQGQPSKGPAASPGTDPTSPIPQESTGEWARAEQENARRLDEPGLDDKDREHRGRER